MNMSLRGDDALRNFHRAAGTDKGTCAGALDVAGFTHGRLDAERSRVGQGNLDLCGASCGTEDGHFKLALFTFDGDLFLTGELTGLAELLFYGELMPFAEQCGDVFLGEMDVSCRGFDQNFIFHYQISFRQHGCLNEVSDMLSSSGNRRSKLILFISIINDFSPVVND